MKLSIFAALLIAAAAALLFSCSEDEGPDPFGPYSYTEIPGTALVFSVENVDTGHCGPIAEVLYNFTPNDSSAIDSHFLVNWPLDSVPYIKPVKWIETHGLLEGTRHGCSRFRLNRKNP